MVSKNTFQTGFGKRVWKELFHYLDKPPEKPVEVSPYIAAALTRPRRIASSSNGTCKRNGSGAKTIREILGEQDSPKRDIQVESTPSVSLEKAVQEEPKFKPEDFEKVLNGSSQERKLSLSCNKTDNPTLYDIVRFYKNEGIVGEESIATAITLASAAGMSFGVEGFSGSGKTFVVDRLMDLLPEEWVYRIELSSKMAVFYDADKINGSKIIYIPELQKAMQDKKSPIIEVIKNLTEGKDAKRIVTRNDKQGNVEYSIKKGMAVIYTLALENYFKKDEESSRRLMRLQTDSSKEHLDDIHSHKARKRFDLNSDPKKAERLKDRLKEHICAIAEMGDVRVLDPCAEYFKEFIPKTQKSVGYVDHYYSLVDACVKFHYAGRETFEINGVEYIVANIEDHFNVFNMYFKEFTHTLKDFAERMENGEEKEDALAALEEIKEPNWAECLGKAQELLENDPSLEELREAKPNLPNLWYQRQCTNEVMSTLDYKTGKPIVIADLFKQSIETKPEEPEVDYSI